MEDIKGYEGIYKVKRNGDVISIKSNRVLKPFKKQGGYWRIGLYKDGKMRHHAIHRLVAITYIPNPLLKPEVNHKNGIKTDNNIINLEWVTTSENQLHAFKLGLQKPLYGEDHQNSKLLNRDVLIIKRMIYMVQNNELNITQKDISKIFGVSDYVISSIKREKHRLKG